MSSEDFAQHLLILGGGSAGWMAAAYLDRNFNRPDRRRLRITVVESEAIGRIGVGEATLPTIRGFAQSIGIDEPTLINRTSATFKHGVQFEGWLKPGHDYFHAFEAIEMGSGYNPGPAWLARRAAGDAGRFDVESGVQRAPAQAGKAPKGMTMPDYAGKLPYAYHLDAEAFGDLLRDVAVARGVERVEGRVETVERSADGDIAALVLADGTRIAADFFIDCSGFRSMLLQETLGVGFIGFDDVISCDRAVAIQSPYPEHASARAFTTASALPAGWAWRIGLQGREGHGYVYSSRHLSAEDAEAALRAHAGLPADAKARHLDMKVGMAERMWDRNVVALGLAAGFVEPLESTGLHFVELALQFLVRYFPLSGINPAARDRFNKLMSERYFETRDFLVAHYCMNQRDEPFWREVREPSRIPDSVKARLSLWRDRHPSREDMDFSQMIFGHSSWQQILYGMHGDTEEARANALKWVPDRHVMLAQRQQAENELMANLPAQSLWLEGAATLPPKSNWAAT